MEGKKSISFSAHGLNGMHIPLSLTLNQGKIAHYVQFITKETSHRNIRSCILPQRCPINDVNALNFFVGFPPNRGIMSLLPKGQS